VPEVKADYENALHRNLKDVKGAQAGKMFGYPVYKANDTMAVSVVKDGIIARVGEQRAKELIGKGGVKAYEPQPGRVWKDWVLLTGDFDKHKDVFKQAIDNTAKMPKEKAASGRKKAAAAEDKSSGGKKSSSSSSSSSKSKSSPKKRSGK
jgi:TfoX/Sxy family transcriptional regulator of competence genes